MFRPTPMWCNASEYQIHPGGPLLSDTQCSSSLLLMSTNRHKRQLSICHSPCCRRMLLSTESSESTSASTTTAARPTPLTQSLHQKCKKPKGKSLMMMMIPVVLMLQKQVLLQHKVTTNVTHSLLSPTIRAQFLLICGALFFCFQISKPCGVFCAF